MSMAQEDPHQPVDGPASTAPSAFSAVQLKRQRNALAPIMSLPSELLLKIFRYFKPREFGPTLQDLVRPTHVCARWRDVALKDGLLWSDLNSDFGPNWLMELVARSAQVPVSVSITLDKHSPLWDDREWVIPQLMWRVLSQTWRLSSLYLSSYEEAVKVILSSMIHRPAPRLESLLVDIPEPMESGVILHPHLFDGKTPALRKVAFFNCALLWTSTIYSTVTSIRIDYEESEFETPFTLQGLQKGLQAVAPHLEQLCLRLYLPGDDGTGFGPAVFLPQLTHLTLEGDPYTAIAILPLLRPPASAELELGCATAGKADLEDLASVLSTLWERDPLVVEGLEVSSGDDELGLIAWREHRQGGGPIRESAVTITSRGQSLALGDFENNIHILFHALPLENLLALDIACVFGLPDSMGEVLSRLSLLQYLTLSTREQQLPLFIEFLYQDPGLNQHNKNRDVTHLPCLKEITISGIPTPAEQLKHLHTTLLERGNLGKGIRKITLEGCGEIPNEMVLSLENIAGMEKVVCLHSVIEPYRDTLHNMR